MPRHAVSTQLAATRMGSLAAFSERREDVNYVSQSIQPRVRQCICSDITVANTYGSDSLHCDAQY